MPQEEPAFAPRLATIVADALDIGSVEIRDLQRNSGGASRATWSFDAVHDSGTEALILRLAAHDVDGAVMMLEAAAMREAARVGVPEPEVLTAAADSSVLGGPYLVMRRVDGETIARRILRDEAYAEVRPRLAAQCGAILGALHQMDPAALPSLSDVDPLDGLRALFAETGVVSPTLELAFRWLATHRPEPFGKAVVHGDFRNGNLIIGSDGIRAVLDWELVHLGDPLEDLGWLCVRAWRFGAEPPVGGFGDYQDLFAAYQQASGRAIDPQAARWWELFGTVKWGVICILQANRHLIGDDRSVELAAIGRRLCEQEYDALGLLDELLAGAVR
ncbi:MAG TPA: phosphotransferase family protein [Mycobacteriales bacterium]|nr:phosphotransferase family protein [Mycobacteriales bacterium]